MRQPHWFYNRGHRASVPKDRLMEPAVLQTWTAGDEEDPLSVIEDDIRVLLGRLSRATADLNEQKEDHRTTTASLLLSLIEILDAFDRVFESARKREALSRETKAFIGNFRTIYRILKNLLRDQGVVPLENLDGGFDPQWHEVGGSVDDASSAEGTIVTETKKGYLWLSHDLVLRRSEVVVVIHGARPPNISDAD